MTHDATIKACFQFMFEHTDLVRYARDCAAFCPDAAVLVLDTNQVLCRDGLIAPAQARCLAEAMNDRAHVFALERAELAEVLRAVPVDEPALFEVIAQSLERLACPLTVCIARGAAALHDPARAARLH
jgi:hypothetical protein